MEFRFLVGVEMGSNLEGVFAPKLPNTKVTQSRSIVGTKRTSARGRLFGHYRSRS